MFNFGAEDFTVRRGDRVAQLILERISTPAVTEVEDLDDTERVCAKKKKKNAPMVCDVVCRGPAGLVPRECRNKHTCSPFFFYTIGNSHVVKIFGGRKGSGVLVPVG